MDHQQDHRGRQPFDQLNADAKEQQRMERIERLLGSLGMKPSTINTAKAFNYSEASRIARRKNNA